MATTTCFHQFYSFAKQKGVIVNAASEIYNVGLGWIARLTTVVRVSIKIPRVVSFDVE